MNIIIIVLAIAVVLAIYGDRKTNTARHGRLLERERQERLYGGKKEKEEKEE